MLQYNIEEDLTRYLALIGAGENVVNLAAIESSTREIENELQRLVPVLGLRQVLRPDRLRYLSSEMAAIQSESNKAIDARLSAYQSNYPDSPLFSSISLFGPIDYGRLETAFTRALAWLMDPLQPHGFGSDIANGVLDLILEKDELAGPVEVSLSVAERKLSNRVESARIDVWIEGHWIEYPDRKMLLVVEAKIDADESDDQLAKYERLLADEPEWIGLFITPAGAASSTGGSNWRQLSIRRLASKLTQYCISERAKHKPGTQFLKLFIAGLLLDVLEVSLPVRKAGSNHLLIADLISDS